jgi:hypothetical protein
MPVLPQRLHKPGEDVTEALKLISRQSNVIQHVPEKRAVARPSDVRAGFSPAPTKAVAPPPSTPLIQTTRLNDADPQAWLGDVLARLPDHPVKRIADHLLWNWSRMGQEKAVA